MGPTARDLPKGMRRVPAGGPAVPSGWGRSSRFPRSAGRMGQYLCICVSITGRRRDFSGDLMILGWGGGRPGNGTPLTPPELPDRDELGFGLLHCPQEPEPETRV